MGFKNPVFILLATLIYSTVLHHSESKEMRAFVGSTVTLPCHVNITKCGELHSVKWYRESSRIYVFSQNGEIKRAEGDAIERMEVVYQPTSTDALLKISQVRIEDEASYKCEITYLDVRENCDIVQVVKLNTLVVPVETRIHNKGVTLENNTVLPPADEGSELELVCEARRGKPTPMVRWFNGTREMKATYTSQNDSDGLGTGTANLRVLLSRGDLKANYECRVESDALDEPLVRTVYPNVSVRPTNVELTGFKDHVVEGTTVFLTCEVSGARPAARIRWQNDTEPVNNKTEITTTFHEQNDGTFKTKSDLLFTSTRFEDEKAFYCFADNDLMVNQNESPLRVVKHMKVYYPPIVWLGMNNVTVNESNPVLLFCSHYANPMKLNNVVWVKDGENLTLNRDRYEGGTPEFPSLRILNVLRTDMGSYTCICGNSVGSTRSNTSVYLDVLYPPTVTVEMSTTTPVKSVDCTNVTLKCSRISGNPEGFKKVHWYLNDLMLTENSCDVTQHDASETCNTTRKCEIDPSLILLERVQEGFAGNYSCAAMNEAGWSDRSNSTQLVVYYPPKGVTLTYTPREVIKNENVTLRCQVKHFGEPLATTYIWYKGGYEVRDVHEATWTIKPVTLEQRANYSCVAANEGGMSKPANTSIEVYAPPAFISKFNSYQGILVTSENVSLSCRIECHPICSIVWEKDGHPLEVNDNPLYYVKTTVYDADFKKNDFESIESTLIFNISSWPGGQLDKTAPNSNYTCKSIKNKVGPGVEATVEIAVDYPPESLITSTRFVEVDEGRKPDPVQCSAKGRPTVQYAWRKEGSTELLSNKPVLQIDRPLSREDSGTYLCEVRNRHGFNSTPVFFNVFYPPECSITMKDVGGKQNLICSAKANPDNVQFTWIEKNETVEVPETSKEGLKSILVLESNVAYARTFVCYANNSVGRSSGCEIDVPGNNVPWWQRLERETMLIIIASIIAIIICVLIVCIIIIILCRRKRANNKLPNSAATGNKNNLGVAPTDGAQMNANPNGNPEDKGFYENLPFHGMQNPPNKTNGTTPSASDTYIY